MQQIKFFNGKTIFSNFHMLNPPMEYQGKPFSNSEAAFQYEKFRVIDPQKAESIRLAPTPAEAKRIARGKSSGQPFNPASWDKRRLDVMRDVLKVKFADPVRKKMLLDTADAELIEDSPYDAFWGVGPKGDGENMLGKLLMELREDLRK